MDRHDYRRWMRGHRNGHLRADIAIEHGKIVAMGKELPRQNAGKVISATGKLVFARRHRRAHASRYAFWRHHQRRRFRNRHTGQTAFGGTTTVINFAIQYKGQHFSRLSIRGMAKACPSKAVLRLCVPLPLT